MKAAVATFVIVNEARSEQNRESWERLCQTVSFILGHYLCGLPIP